MIELKKRRILFKLVEFYFDRMINKHFTYLFKRHGEDTISKIEIDQAHLGYTYHIKSRKYNYQVISVYVYIYSGIDIQLISL